MRANKLRIIETVLESNTQLIANMDAWQDGGKRRKLEDISHAAGGGHRRPRQGGADAERPQGTTFAAVLDVLPALHKPTISTLSDEEWVAVNTILEESTVRVMIPRLKEAGCSGDRGVPAEQDRVVRGGAVAGVYASKLIESVPRIADIVSFRFKRPEAYRFQAGQWFVITFPSADPEEPWEHHFSHSDAPSDPWMEFTTRLRGSDFKNALSALPAGSPVEVEGPYGAFVVPPDVERAAFLAGGIGITCARSILRWVAHVWEAARVDPPAGGEETALALREVVLFFANRSEDAIPFEDELEELSRKSPWLRIVHVISQPGEAWQGYSGHVDRKILEEELGDPASWCYFVSGPPPFDLAMREMLLAGGISDDRVKLERFEGY